MLWFTIFSIVGIMLAQIDSSLLMEFNSASFMVITYLVLLVSIFSFSKATQDLDAEKFRFMLQQNQENEMFKRVIDSVEDSMLIASAINPSEITFKNKSASTNFFQASNSIEASLHESLERAQIYPFDKDRATAPDARSQLEPEALSLKDLLSR